MYDTDAVMLAHCKYTILSVHNKFNEQYVYSKLMK